MRELGGPKEQLREPRPCALVWIVCLESSPWRLATQGDVLMYASDSGSLPEESDGGVSSRLLGHAQ